MKKAINLAYVSGGGGDTYQECEEFVSEQLESPQQPKMPVGFECDMIYRVKSGTIQEHKEGKAGYEYYEPKTTTNSQGLTQWVGRYIYE
jgi:hypothetical protein